MQHGSHSRDRCHGQDRRAVAVELLRRGRRVRAVVRSVDARSERLTAAGAEIVVADMFDHAQLLGAMTGVSRAYYCPPWHPFMLQSAAAFAVAARDARLEAVVVLGQWLANPVHPALQTRQTWLTHHLVALIPNATHTIVNPGYFADNYLNCDLLAYATHLGIYPTPTGVSRNAPPSNEDIARVVVAALLDPARHAGRSYRPTGPALLSAHDMAAILERVFGRRVRPFDMPLWLFLKAANASGFPPFMHLTAISMVS